MVLTKSRAAVAAMWMAAMVAPVAAEETFQGYLCCNMRTDGSWISDSNYAENGKRVIAAGTPVTVTGYGRNRVHITIDGAKQDIGNDYSRDLSLPDFAHRYVVAQDPKAAIARFSPKVREAIQTQRISKGMTREQVIMSLGYPISSENPNLDASLWRMWRSSFSEFQIQFDAKGRVRDVTTDPQTRNLVVMD